PSVSGPERYPTRVDPRERFVEPARQLRGKQRGYLHSAVYNWDRLYNPAKSGAWMREATELRGGDARNCDIRPFASLTAQSNPIVAMAIASIAWAAQNFILAPLVFAETLRSTTLIQG